MPKTWAIIVLMGLDFLSVQVVHFSHDAAVPVDDSTKNIKAQDLDAVIDKSGGVHRTVVSC